MLDLIMLYHTTNNGVISQDRDSTCIAVSSIWLVLLEPHSPSKAQRKQIKIR